MSVEDHSHQRLHQMMPLDWFIICLAVGARVMLSANLWVDMRLVNGSMGTVKDICYCAGSAPPNLPTTMPWTVAP